MPIPFFGALTVPWLSADHIDWGRLERASKLTFTQEQRDELLKTLNSFLTEMVRQSLSPSAKDVRGWVNGTVELALTLDSAAP
jgi:hypothetical protein